MDYNEMIGLMAQYNLTLRHIPDEEVSFYVARDKELDPANLKENQTLIVWDNWKDGVPRTMVRTANRRTCCPWMVLIDNTFMSLQRWAEKNDKCFSGNTPEEAIMRAVEHIKNKK